VRPSSGLLRAGALLHRAFLLWLLLACDLGMRFPLDFNGIPVTVKKYKKEGGESNMHPCLTLEYWLDSGWYVGRVKEVPGVFSQGKTLAELKVNIQDAHHLMMEEIAENDQNDKYGVKKKEMLVQV
jgi:predicted RNase H-like HicB family nuclease